jgi:hypothetical protein
MQADRKNEDGPKEHHEITDAKQSQPSDTTCFFNFNETTLAAHSFDWVVTDLASGNYGITVSWRYNNNGTSAPIRRWPASVL